MFLAPLYVFFTLFRCWGWGGAPKGPGHNLLMQFSSLGSSKMVVPRKHNVIDVDDTNSDNLQLDVTVKEEEA